MGVPRFFKWLAERYPCVVAPFIETTTPSIDNLYLDMNGIIHNCTHPKDDSDEEKVIILNERQAMFRIFQYIDKLFDKIKPRKYFYMAIDGVAPRAKMNQQRQRRFRSAMDADNLKKKLEKEGKYKASEDEFDSNCITPGTSFMHQLSVNLEYFVRKKMQEDINWQRCTVIFSGHDVPGEGEHKIMDFIRARKKQADYLPNESHCLYGLDADLIMLGLMSHEPHFVLLREDVFSQMDFSKKKKPQNKPLDTKFHLLHLSMLREYLDLEFKDLQLTKIQYNLERIIDDFVLMCFFCGNDFLPHMPTLDIGEGAIHHLFEVYRAVLPTLDGYLTDSKTATIYWERVEVFLRLLAQREDILLEQRFKNVLYSKKRGGRRRRGPRADHMSVDDIKTRIAQTIMNEIGDPSFPEGEEGTAMSSVLDSLDYQQPEMHDLHSEFHEEEDVHGLKAASAVLGLEEFEREPMIDPSQEILHHEDEEEDHEDKERDSLLILAVDPQSKMFDFKKWHDIYYRSKFEIDPANKEERKNVVKAYIEGIIWAFNYYINGCISWKWFYPYHYSPVACDLVDLKEIADSVNLSLGQPFRPFEQLLGVLPPKSAKLLPKPYQTLVLSSVSPIIDFYPNEVKIDREGTKYDYEGTVLLPFINEDRLVNAIAKVQNQLSSQETERNQFGVSTLFVYDEKNPAKPYLYKSPIQEQGFNDIENCTIKVQKYSLPEAGRFTPELCKGVKLGVEGPEGFPTLETHKFEASLMDIGVNIFQFPSKRPSMLLRLVDPNQRTQQQQQAPAATTTEQQPKPSPFKQHQQAPKPFSGMRAAHVRHLIGKRVYIGFPYPRLALVSSVADQYESYYEGYNQSHDKNTQGEFVKEAEYHQQMLLRKYAIDVGQVTVLLYVKLFKGMFKDFKGNVRKSFHESEFAYPYQLLIPKEAKYTPIPDPKFTESQEAPRIQEEFNLGKNVVYLGKEYYGRVAAVSSHAEDYINIKFDTVPQAILNYQPPAEVSKYSSQHYYPLRDVAKQLGLPNHALSPKVLGGIIGRSMLVFQDGKKVDVGLGLRNPVANKRVIGYCRSTFNEQAYDETYFLNQSTNTHDQKKQPNSFSVGGTSAWEISDKAIALIGDYYNKFPKLFEALAQTNSFEVIEIFGDEEQAAQYLAGVEAFLKQQKEYINTLPFLGIEADLLPAPMIKQIEQSLVDLSSKAKHEQAVQSAQAEEIKVFKSFMVYRPPDPFPQAPRNVFDVGHRVVNISAGGQIPFGLRGIIIGIQGLTAQVVFDEEFVGGTTFSEKLTTFRGQTAPLSTLVNLTAPHPREYRAPQIKTERSHQAYNQHYYSVDQSTEVPTRTTFSGAPKPVQKTDWNTYKEDKSSPKPIKKKYERVVNQFETLKLDDHPESQVRVEPQQEQVAQPSTTQSTAPASGSYVPPYNPSMKVLPRGVQYNKEQLEQEKYTKHWDPANAFKMIHAHHKSQKQQTQQPHQGGRQGQHGYQGHQGHQGHQYQAQHSHESQKQTRSQHKPAAQKEQPVSAPVQQDTSAQQQQPQIQQHPAAQSNQQRPKRKPKQPQQQAAAEEYPNEEAILQQHLNFVPQQIYYPPQQFVPQQYYYPMQMPVPMGGQMPYQPMMVPMHDPAYQQAYYQNIQQQQPAERQRSRPNKKQQNGSSSNGGQNQQPKQQQ